MVAKSINKTSIDLKRIVIAKLVHERRQGERREKRGEERREKRRIRDKKEGEEERTREMTREKKAQIENDRRLH